MGGNVTMRIQATLAIAAHDTVGESPAWDGGSGRLLWTENGGGVVHEARPQADGGWSETRRWTLNRPIAAITPRAKGGLVVVAGLEVLMASEAGDISPFVRLDADPAAVSFNDAKCDPQGRLWAGTQAIDRRRSDGALYRIDPDGAVNIMLENVCMSNGCDWSPDGRTFYYIDTFTFSIDAFDFDSAQGLIANRRKLVTLAADEGFPDGMTVDNEGCLWVALLGKGEVRRYAPSGGLLACVSVPTPAVTNCVFGGPDGDVLLITSGILRVPDALLARFGLTVEQAESAAKAAEAGGLFMCRPGCNGRPATPFAG